MLRWIKPWPSRERQEHDLQEEIRSHLEIERANQIAAGSSSQDAEHSAKLAFGNMLKTEEDVRETWGWGPIERLWQDIRFGIRGLRKTPVWTFVIGTTLAFGIGAATAIFSLVYSVLIQPLPYPEPDRIVAMWPTALKNGGDRFRVSAGLYKYWQENLTLVQEIALTRPVANFNLTGVGAPERLQGARTTSNVPLTLKVTPMLGRYFTTDEQLTDAKVAVVSHRFWVRRFGADSSVIGRKIQLNGEAFEVLGVMPRDYAYPDANFELWTPLFIPPAELRHGVNHQYLAIGRLRPGANVEQASAEITTIAGRLAREYPAAYKADDQWVGALVEPLADSQSFQVRGTLWALMAASGCLLLIGCMNLAVLLIARASARSREMAMRIALGAGAGRLRRQLLAEALPLSAVGCLGGVLLAWALVKALPAWLPADLPRVETLGLHSWVVTFAIGSSLAVVILASLLPARIASRAGLNEVLQHGSRSVSQRIGAREPLVIAQIAIAVVLVFAGVLLGRSLAALLRVSPGFEAQGRLTMHIAVTRAKYSSDARVAAYYERIVGNVRTLPGVIDGGIVNRLPFSGLTQNGGVEFEGKEGSLSADWRVATPGYFNTMGIPLKQGRSFSEADRPSAPQVGIIDDVMARRVFGAGNPLGRRFRRSAGGSNPQEAWVEIVGVVGHVLNDSLEKDLRPQVYWPESQSTQDRGVLVVRTAGRPASYAAGIIDQIRQLDPDQPVYEVRSMDDWVAKSMQSRSVTTGLSSLFGIAALALACLGIYGVVSYTTEQRFREFGVRMALGAEAGRVRNLVLQQAGRLSVLGAALGLVLCWPIGMFLESMLFGISNRDVIAWSLAPGLLVTAALAAGLGPALRAARTDPAEVLRSE